MLAWVASLKAPSWRVRLNPEVKFLRHLSLVLSHSEVGALNMIVDVFAMSQFYLWASC